MITWPWWARRWLEVHLVIVLAIGASTSGWSQTRPEGETDLLLRAAYCVGALKENIKLDSETSSPDDHCSTKWAEYKFGSAEACAAGMAGLREGMRESLEQPLKRYARYVAARMAAGRADDVQQRQGGMRHSVAIAMISGQNDVRNLEKRADTYTLKCFEDCRAAASSSCLTDCVAKHDRVHANILRCFVTDDLPF